MTSSGPRKLALCGDPKSSSLPQKVSPLSQSASAPPTSPAVHPPAVALVQYSQQCSQSHLSDEAMPACNYCALGFPTVTCSACLQSVSVLKKKKKEYWHQRVNAIVSGARRLLYLPYLLLIN